MQHWLSAARDKYKCGMACHCSFSWSVGRSSVRPFLGLKVTAAERVDDRRMQQLTRQSKTTNGAASRHHHHPSVNGTVVDYLLTSMWHFVNLTSSRESVGLLTNFSAYFEQITWRRAMLPFFFLLFSSFLLLLCTWLTIEDMPGYRRLVCQSVRLTITLIRPQ